MVHFGSLDCCRRAAVLYRQARDYLSHDAGERTIFRRLQTQPERVHLRLNRHNDDSYNADAHVLHWDPYSALRTTRGGRQSPALGLGHEADHATETRAALLRGWNHPLARYDDVEERRVIRGSEAHAAQTLGEAQRYDHAGRCYRVATPLAR